MASQKPYFEHVHLHICNFLFKQQRTTFVSNLAIFMICNGTRDKKLVPIYNPETNEQWVDGSAMWSLQECEQEHVCFSCFSQSLTVYFTIHRDVSASQDGDKMAMSQISVQLNGVKLACNCNKSVKIANLLSSVHTYIHINYLHREFSQKLIDLKYIF